MFGKVKQFLQKIRIFKRLRAYRAGIQILLDYEKIYQGRIDGFKKEIKGWVETFNRLTELYEDVKERHDKATKHYGELIKRRNETIHRLQSTAPDDILSGRFADYKLWIAEPLIKKDYKNYIVENDIGIGRVFIDGESAIRGLDKIFKGDIEKKEIVEEKEGED